MSKPIMPYIRFFPSDWLADEKLRLVSFAARGLWIDLLCLMAKSDPRGYLTVNGGVKPTPLQIARLVGCGEGEVTPLVEELKQALVCSENEAGVIFCRRMVRDSVAYDQSVKFGKKGGNPSLKQDKAETKAKDKGKVKGGDNLMASNLASGFSILISEMKQEPAYTGIDIEHEANKAIAWAKKNRRQFTERFFVNWLNKADRPLNGAPPAMDDADRATAEFMRSAVNGGEWKRP